MIIWWGRVSVQGDKCFTNRLKASWPETCSDLQSIYLSGVFFPPGKKSSMLPSSENRDACFLGRLAVGSSRKIPGISTHLLGCWAEWGPPMDTPDLPGDSPHSLSHLHGCTPAALGVWEHRGCFGLLSLPTGCPALGLIPILENSEEAVLPYLQPPSLLRCTHL